jgi:hypothetical protein
MVVERSAFCMGAITPKRSLSPRTPYRRCSNAFHRIKHGYHTIKTQRDYRRTLKEIEGLMNAKRNTPEGDRLDVLVMLVEAWEAKRYPFDPPTR